MGLIFPLVKDKKYLPNPISRNGIPTYADSSLNPKVIGTQAYNDFWNEQLYYIHNGYETGGIKIPGRYYYFLNFVRLPSVRGIMYPEILDYQLEFFLLVEQAKTEHKGIIAPKARRKGLSVMVSSIIDHGWRFSYDYKCGVSAGLREYVNEFISKWNNIHRNVFDEFKTNTITTDEDEIVAGWKEKDDFTGFLQKGTSNSIIQKTMFHNANLFKGYYLNDCVFEECGEFTKLIETYNATKSCFMDGSIQRGTPFLFGTGGRMSMGTKDLQELWHEHEAHGLLRYFVPAQKFYAPFYSGYVDENGKLAEQVPNLKLKYKDFERVGMDDEEVAIEFIKKEKSRLQKQRNKKAYFDYCQNNPTDIREVFLESAANNFDPEILNEQMFEIQSQEQKYLRYKLEYKKKSDGTPFSPQQVEAIPIGEGEDESETIMILNGYGPATSYKYLDIAGLDGYDMDESQTSKSLGSMVIIRRQNTIEGQEGMLPIAVIWTRPKRREMFYDLCLKAAVYFNLVDSVLFDVRSPLVSKHFEDNEGWKFLADRPKKFETENSTQTHVKGVSLNAYSKPVMLSLLQSFFLDNGKKIWFPCIIEEALRYDSAGKITDCDSVDALGIALMCLVNMGYDVIDENDDKRESAYDFPKWNQDEDGNWRDSTSDNFDIKKYVKDPEILNNEGLLREAEFYLKNSR